MSYFGEKLSEAVRASGVRASEICRKTELNKSYFSKMKNGSMLPADCGIVRAVAEAMGLDVEGTSSLCRAYMVSKLGEKYINIEAALKNIFSIRSVQPEINDITQNDSLKLQNGVSVSGRRNVYHATGQLFENSTKSIQILFSADNEELCTVINKLLTFKKSSFMCNIMLYLNNESDISAYNINTLSSIMPVILSGKADIHYEYTDIEHFYSLSLYPYIIINEHEVLLIKHDCSGAVYLNSENTVKEYQNFFQKKYKGSEKFCFMFDNIGEFINGISSLFVNENSHKLVDLYVVKANPCVMFEANSKVVDEHICDKSAHEGFVEDYMNFLMNHTIKNVKRHITMFSDKGVKDFLENEIYYEFNKFIDLPVSKELRRKFFRKFIKDAHKTSAIQVNMMHDDFFSECRHCANIWSDGKMLMVFNFDDDYRIVVCRERSIISTFINFINALKTSGVTLSKKEILAAMEQNLERYDSVMMTDSECCFCSM
ncbi:MAG: hypothetical protein ACI4J2_11885 [Ruminococcus sp.]